MEASVIVISASSPRLVRDLRCEALRLTLVTPVLANLDRKLGDEAVIAGGDVQGIGGDAWDADFADGDDAERGNDIRTVEVVLIVDAREHDSLF